MRRLHTDGYAPRDHVLDVRSEVSAAMLALPAGTLVTGVTALWCYGVEVGRANRLKFVTAHPHQVRRPGLHVSRTRKLPRSQGHAVVVEHAFATAARRLDLLDLVTAGDWLVRLKRTTPARLISYSNGYRGAAAPLARRAAAMVRQRVDPPGESKLRLCLVLAGLPEPECNISLGTDDWPIARVDLLIRAYRLILEYEGDQHRTGRWQWNLDISRVEELSAEGYRVLRVTALHMRHPRALVRRVTPRSLGAATPVPRQSSPPSGRPCSSDLAR